MMFNFQGSISLLTVLAFTTIYGRAWPKSIPDITSDDKVKELDSALAGLNPVASFISMIDIPEDNTPQGPEDEDDNASASGEGKSKADGKQKAEGKQKPDCDQKEETNETTDGPALIHMDFDHMCQQAKDKNVKILPVYVVGWELKQCSDINDIPFKRFQMEKYQTRKPKFDIPGMCPIKGREMTIMMIDPDAPSRKNHRCRSWLHWLVVNIPKGNVSKGEEIVEYKPPSPSVGSGPHRYFFILYDQNYHIKQVDDSENNFAVRCGFSVRNFAEDNALVGPVAINMFKTNNKKDP